MSEERLCEAYGEHQAYCSMHGYPIGKSVEELLAEARATAVAPLETVIRDAMAACPVCGGFGWVQETRDDGDGNPEPYQAQCWDAEHSILASHRISAPSPVREPEGLDVERLTEGLRAKLAELDTEADRLNADPLRPPHFGNGLRYAALAVGKCGVCRHAIAHHGHLELDGRWVNERRCWVNECKCRGWRVNVAATPERPADEVDG